MGETNFLTIYYLHCFRKQLKLCLVYRVRILTTVTIGLAALFVLRQWPEVQDIGSHVMRRLKDTLDPVK